MLNEVELFLTDLFQNDRPLTNLLDSDYSFINHELAEHYGIAHDGSDEFNRVLIDEHRGGLAGMGLFLTKTSLPLRTSPVQRGVWMLEKLLGDELPNPPADVPSLSEDDQNELGENIQQQLQRHRESATCASCHNKIDPLGIALENYDPIGRWRETDRDGTPLATDSISHDGFDLRGARAIKQYLRSRQDEVFRHFNRKLLGYALGRSVGPGDKHLLARMQAELVSNNYQVSAVIKEIVASPQFRRRRQD